jgi:hypothetical protein
MTTRAMSPLRQRMLEDMQLRGLSARTQEAYARAVWQLAEHYHRSPVRNSFSASCCIRYRVAVPRSGITVSGVLLVEHNSN